MDTDGNLAVPEEQQSTQLVTAATDGLAAVWDITGSDCTAGLKQLDLVWQPHLKVRSYHHLDRVLLK